MEIRVENPVEQTIYFGVLFFLTVLLSVKKHNEDYSFNYSITTELKGFAILAIIFSHTGYFLSESDQFLYPLSILAGVGVNLFLFLSGFGLTVSALRSQISIKNFYRKRLMKLFLPLWVVLIFLIGIDSIILHKNYTFPTLVQSFLGFFPKADIFQNIDSPLWYFTLIFFYYLIFPIFFLKRAVYLAPLMLLILPFLLLQFPLPIDPSVLSLYKLHFVSFPLGVFFGLVTHDKTFIHLKLESKKVLSRPFLKYVLMILFLGVFAYTSINSGVDGGKLIEQTTSLITMFSIIFLFLIKKLDFRLFSLFGIYSYEIYLIHWPILSRYNLFLGLAPFLMTALNLILIFSLGYLLHKVIEKISKKTA